MLARKLAAAPMTVVHCLPRQAFWMIRLREVAGLPARLADQAVRVQQKESRWGWLEDYTTGRGAKARAVIPEPHGIQARGNSVDEQRKSARRGGRQLESEGRPPASVYQDFGLLFHRPAHAVRRLLSNFRATRLRYDVVPPRTLNDSEQTMEA